MSSKQKKILMAALAAACAAAAVAFPEHAKSLLDFAAQLVSGG